MRIMIIILMFTTNTLAEEIIGISKIVDGDTLYINNYSHEAVTL